MSLSQAKAGVAQAKALTSAGVRFDLLGGTSGGGVMIGARMETLFLISQDDADRFARTMSDMRFLFDKDFDSFVGVLHGALVKKHALDALLEKAANYAHSPEDQALTDLARRRSRELASQITEAIDREMPERMEKFLHPRPIV
jgi:hypothetical protein